MTSSFPELLRKAEFTPGDFAVVSRHECLHAVREYVAEQRQEARDRHNAGESGGDILHMLAAIADTVLRGVFTFGLHSVPHRQAFRSRICLCALGGYGRAELSPYSDLDVCLLYEGELDEYIKTFNRYLLQFLWDAGFVVGYTLRSIPESLELVACDKKALTSFSQGRFLEGDSSVFARLKLHVRDLQSGEGAKRFVEEIIHERFDGLQKEFSDLYPIEPDIKHNAGGLRDFHAGLWLYMMAYGAGSLDDAAGQGLITADEHLDIVEALDFIWRVRNELHFHSGKADDRLTFANQQHVAKAFGYSSDATSTPSRFMQDYYAASRVVRHFLRTAAATLSDQYSPSPDSASTRFSPGITVLNDELYAGHGDRNWFAENPARLMDVFWQCARHGVTLSRATEREVMRNLHLVGDTFRSNELVRRFFVAICNRPLNAGRALRQAGRAGLLGRYIPEYEVVRGVVRYEDFHHYPVGEHTLRAVEALGQIPDRDDPVSRCLREALENLSDPYILVMAILLHDLGKIAGDVHIEESVRIAHAVCRRLGMHEDDEERITFLVRHHMVMTQISQYRDIGDENIVQSFAETMKSEQRLRALFLLSYADLSAVGPNVWNDWKGALLMRLYLRAEKVLLGRAETVGEAYWATPRAQKVCGLLREDLQPRLEEHLRALGERYFLAFAPQQIAEHLECLSAAEQEGLALRRAVREDTGMTEVCISTQDRRGLFAVLAGSFASQLIDVRSAALFTRPDGYVIDSFTVAEARSGRPVTQGELNKVEDVLRAVLLRGEDISRYVEQARHHLFALLQPRIPIRTKIEFDNHSSRTLTVVDVETGDRTGLLYDIAQAITDTGLDIASARIATDARRVRDSFYVSLNNGKIQEEDEQERIRDTIYNAIHQRSSIETKGGTS